MRVFRLYFSTLHLCRAHSAARHELSCVLTEGGGYGTFAAGGEGGGGVYPGSWHEARKRGGGLGLGAPRMCPLHPTPQISGILAFFSSGEASPNSS